MLLKSFFNLETNTTANLPNEYFLILEKQQKYKQLTDKLLRLNQFNQNIINSTSTIKITLKELVNDFLKPPQNSFLQKVEQALLSAYETVNKVSLNLLRTVQLRLMNYESQIYCLNKKYKEKLEQVMHYRKKVQSIKKEYQINRDEKERLDRNLAKKELIEEECHDVEELLKLNYDNFHSESEKYVKQIPNQIILQLIQAKLLTYTKLSELVDQQLPILRSRRRQESIKSSVMSEISDVEGDGDELSQYSEVDLGHFEQLQIIIEPELESNQIINSGSDKIQSQKQYGNSSNHKLKDSNLHKWSEYKGKTSRKSLTRKASIEQKIKTKENLLQKIRKILEIETQNCSNKHSKPLQLDKVFQTIEAPLTTEEHLAKIFHSIKNVYSRTSAKLARKTTTEKIIQFADKEPSHHEKSFVLEKQEFRKKHSSSLQVNYLKVPQVNSRNEFTLSQHSDEGLGSSEQNPNHPESNVSLSSIMSKSHEGHSVQLDEKNNRTDRQKNNKEQKDSILINKESLFVHSQKNKYLRPASKSIIQQKIFTMAPQSTDYLSVGLIGGNRLEDKNSKKQKKLDDDQKKRVIEHLFSVSTLKTPKNQQFEKQLFQSRKPDETIQKKKQETGSKYWFSTNFLSPKNLGNLQKKNIASNSRQQQIKKSDLGINRLSNMEKKIDFSIFSKII